MQKGERTTNKTTINIWTSPKGVKRDRLNLAFSIGSAGVIVAPTNTKKQKKLKFPDIGSGIF